MKRERSFAPLFVTNLFGTMNDNYLKTLASFVVMGWIADPAVRPVFMGVTAGALVLPYILFSPLADRLTVLFPKRRILQFAKLAEVPIVAVAALGLCCHSAALVVAAVLLMGLQSALYSPAKYALVRDIGGEDRISTGMGGMEGASFTGVLAGTVVASLLADGGGLGWQVAVFFVLAALGFAGSCAVRADEQPNRTIHSVNPARYLRRAYRMTRRYPGLNAVIVTLSVFWWGAAMLQMGLLVYAREALRLDSTSTGLLLCAAAVGIVLGQVLAGLVDRRHRLLGLTPLTGVLAGVLCAVLFAAPLSPGVFAAVLFALCFDLGFFKLPFDAEIQRVAKGPRLNTMLAYFNQVSFLFMLFASGCYAAVSWLFGPRAFLLLLAAVFAVAPLAFALCYRSVLLGLGRWIFSRRYAVAVEGLPGLPADRPCLVLPNHPAMVDPMLLVTTLAARPLRPLADELFFKSGVFAPRILRTLQAVVVPDLRAHRSKAGASIARGLCDVVTGALADGSCVLLYPSGHIQTEADREDIGTRQLAYNACRALPEGALVIGVRTRGLWGSIWSRCGRRASPKFLPTLVRSVLLWLFAVPFLPRRRVTLHLEDLTARARGWAELSRLDFNRQLGEWYNG